MKVTLVTKKGFGLDAELSDDNAKILLQMLNQGDVVVDVEGDFEPEEEE